ncbi:MAG TPA: hypothetical protein PKK26_10505, partial [Candidatus Wallbacteria bacterium]|nr:hypothetical protein [Candidatus Wallbacteria bacterium]
MENDILKKLDSLSRHNNFVEKFQAFISPFLATILIFILSSFFVTLHSALWLLLLAAGVVSPLAFYISSALKKTEKKDHYRKIDEMLDMKERAVTYYESSLRAGADDAPEMVEIARKDFHKTLSASAGDILKNDSAFNNAFHKEKAHLNLLHRRLILACCVFSAFNFYNNYWTRQTRNMPVKSQSVEKKEIKNDA